MVKKAKFLGYCSYISKNIQRDFQICISVPLRQFAKIFVRILQSTHSKEIGPQYFKYFVFPFFGISVIIY